MVISIIIIGFILSVIISFLLFYRLNLYINKLERIIEDNKVLTENLKQSFKEVLIDNNFLLDDGKIRKTIFEKEKPVIFNGAKVEDQGIEF